MALNTTGTPSTANYVLGRGVVYISPLSNGATTGFIDLGNAPAFSASVDVEELLHQSSRSGTRVTDKRVIISRTVSLSLTVDEITHDNLALFFVGSTSSAANSVLTADIGTTGDNSTAVTFAAANGWSKGRWYNMVDGNGDRFSLASATGVVIVNDAAGTPAALSSSDYTLDLDMGRVFIHHDATADVTKTLGVLVESDNQSAARATIQKVEALKGTNTEYAVKFVMENPANNDEPLEFLFHSVQLAADGELALIGDEFSQIQLSGTAQVDDNGDTLTITGLSAT